MSATFDREIQYNKFCPLQGYLNEIFNMNLIQVSYLQYFQDVGYNFDKAQDALCKGINIKNLQVGKEHEYLASMLSFYSPCMISPISLSNFHDALGNTNALTIEYFFRFLSRFPCYLFNRNMSFKTNVGTLLLFYNRRIDIVQNQPRNVYLMNQINVRELFRKDNQDLTDDFIDVFKDIFQQQFDLIIQTCYIYYYMNDHGTDVFDQVFYFTNDRMVSVVYTKGTIAGGNFDVQANYTATMGIQLNNVPLRSFDGYNSRNDYSTHFGAGVVDLAARWRPPFGMFVTLTLDNQKIFYRFIGNLLWYFFKLSIAEDALARRPLFINVWGTLLYKKDLDIANLYNYDNTLYWLNQCLEKKIFYYNVISNDSSKYLTSSRAASFHVCIPYKFCRFEMTSNLLTDFYPFVNFFSKIIDKPEVIQKLSDFGRNLLSRFLKSVSQENTNVFIPNLFKRK